MFGRTHIVSTWKTGFSFIYKLWDSSVGPAGFVSIYTHEVIKGKRIKIIDKFQAYHSFAGSIKGRTDFLKNNRRYKTLFESTDPIAWAEGLQKARYATDPNYAKVLTSIMKSWKLI